MRLNDFQIFDSSLPKTAQCFQLDIPYTVGYGFDGIFLADLSFTKNSYHEKGWKEMDYHFAKADEERKESL